MRKTKAQKEADARVVTAQVVWATLKSNPEATHEQRLAAKDDYNRAVRDKALAYGTRGPYG